MVGIFAFPLTYSSMLCDSPLAVFFSLGDVEYLSYTSNFSLAIKYSTPQDERWYYISNVTPT
jgi:hypothetical protein